MSTRTPKLCARPSAARRSWRFKDGEVYHLPLQPIAHYRRRQLEHLNEWLPREKLFAMPRSLKTQGSRALGRLAFSDNYLRARRQAEEDIQEATHPDALYRAVSETGLALRDNVPRVYVVAGAPAAAAASCRTSATPCAAFCSRCGTRTRR